LNRDLILASPIGTAGALLLAFGIMGLNGTADFVHAEFNEPTTALGLIAGGCVLMMLELRLIVPIIRAMASRQCGSAKEHGKI
jgi:hypothetical protein